MRLSVIKKCICYITAVSVTVMLAAPVVSYGTAEDDVKLSNADLGYVEGEVLVTFKEDVSEKEAVEIAQDVTDCEATVLETPQAESTTVLAKTDEDKDVEKLVKKYEKDREVAYAQPNYLYRIETEDDNDQPSIADDIKTSFNDPLYSQQWYIDKIDADDAWKLISEKYRGKEKVKVAVLDLGTKLDHKDLKDAMLTGNCVEVPKAAPGDKPDLSLEVELKPYSTPRGYHGTLVGGVIAAVPNNGEGIVGVANGLAELMSIAVFRYREGQADSQKLAASEDVVAGINYAVKNGAKVINMSFGHGLGSQSATNDQLLEDTINKVTKEDNVTIVCSAGNNDNTGLWLPSDFDATISVISTDNYSSAFDNSRSSFSSYGKDKTLSAPGKKIITTNTQGRYESPSGTSMAAPVVASVAAMMYYVNPDIKANDVKRILCDTATDLYETGWDDQTGYGNVNAYAAVAKAAGLEVDNKPARLTPPTITSVASAGLGRLTVKWTPVADAEGYYLYRSTSPNGTYSYVGAVREKGKTSYTNGSRKLNSRYYYKVKAFGTVDNKKTFSDYSNYGAGAATGKISGISAKSATYSSVKVSWNRVQDASGYKIYRATSPRGRYKQVKRITKGSTTSWRNTGLKSGKRYYYKVKAFKTSVNGPISGYASARALPAKVSIAVSKSKSTVAKVKWSKVSSVTGYKIYRATSKKGKYKLVTIRKSSAKNYYYDKKLKRGKRYYYKVKAYKKIGRKTINGYNSSIKNVKL